MSSPIRNEHPRPDLQRSAWMTLNGPWAFAFDRQDRGLRDKWYRHADFPLTIEVPFAYQSELSGVNSQEACNVVWYRRRMAVPASMRGLRKLLHFGAVDYRADVWLNGQYLGSHEGGYTPFAFDVTDLLRGHTSESTLVVRCEDRLEVDQPRGKQSWKPDPFACWYTPVTGIWQSVWLEGVGEYYPTGLRLTPDLPEGALKVELTLNELPPEGSVRLTARWKGQLAASQEITVTDRLVRTTLYLRHSGDLEGVHLWWPWDPSLYDLTVETLTKGHVCDRVETYFGMRSIRVEGEHVLLNNQTIQQRLVLDQGFWPHSLYTAPSDDALRLDVELTLRMGYNGARKHQKFEDPRYLYWADRLGLLVWGELPSAYWLRDSEKRNMIRDLSEAIARDYNHPCLITWVPLNESWGVPFIQHQREAQQLADTLYHLVHCLDGTRPVSGNDGWEESCTDLVTVHDYTAWPEQLKPVYTDEDKLLHSAPGSTRLTSAHGYEHHGKPKLLTEYGGIAMANDAGNGNWGYNGAEAGPAAFLRRFEAITQAFKHMPGFSGYCYTQLTDVYQEVNGLLDMDRRPKADLEEIRRINEQL